MGCRRAAQDRHRSGPGRQRQRRCAQGIRLHPRSSRPPTSATAKRSPCVRSAFMMPAAPMAHTPLSPERLAERRDRHRRGFEQEPRALLGRQHGRRRDLSRTSAPCLRRNCANSPGSCPHAAGEQGDRPADSLQPAHRLRSTSKRRTTPWARRATPAAGGVLPPDLVGFDRGAEAVTANYSLNSGPATLTIIDYPTPQMAAARRNEDSRLHQGRQRRRSPPFPSRSPTPTRPRSKSAAADRSWCW